LSPSTDQAPRGDLNPTIDGGGEPDEEDKYLLKCNHLDLATTNGEQQEYWLLAIKAARTANNTTAMHCKSADIWAIFFSRLLFHSSLYRSSEFPRQVFSPGRRTCPLCGLDCIAVLILLVAYEDPNYG
jgi:hypothetical protein